jgi:hypothetical protein
MYRMSNYDIDLLNGKRREPAEFLFGNGSPMKSPGRRAKRRTCTKVNVQDFEVPFAVLMTGAMLVDLHSSQACEQSCTQATPSAITTTAACAVFPADDVDTQEQSVVMGVGGAQILSSDEDDVKRENSVMQSRHGRSKPVITSLIASQDDPITLVIFDTDDAPDTDNDAPKSKLLVAPPDISAALAQQLLVDLAHDEFFEPQEGWLCLMHAVHNALGFCSEHFALGKFDDAAILGKLPTSTSDGFTNHGGFGTDTIFRVFEAAKHVGFQVLGCESHAFDDTQNMLNAIETSASKGQLRGFVMHRPLHWVGHRLQSTGCFVELDSQRIAVGAERGQAIKRQPHRTTLQLIAHAKIQADLGHRIFAVFHSSLPGKVPWRRPPRSVSSAVVGARNTGNLCFATTACVVACATLHHLGLPSVASEQIGWGADFTANSAIALGFARQHIQHELVLGANGLLQQNDYSEVLGGMMSSIPCLQRATLHNGTQKVAEIRLSRCLRSGDSQQHSVFSTPIQMSTDAAMFEQWETDCGSTSEQVPPGDNRMCRACSVSDLQDTQHLSNADARALYEFISGLPEGERSAVEESTHRCNQLGERYEMRMLDTAPDVLWLDWGAAILAAASLQLPRPMVCVSNLSFTHKSGREMKLIACILYGGEVDSESNISRGHYWSLVRGTGHGEDWFEVNDDNVVPMTNLAAQEYLECNSSIIRGLIYMAAECIRTPDVAPVDVAPIPAVELANSDHHDDTTMANPEEPYDPTVPVKPGQLDDPTTPVKLEQSAVAYDCRGQRVQATPEFVDVKSKIDGKTRRVLQRQHQDGESKAEELLRLKYNSRDKRAAAQAGAAVAKGLSFETKADGVTKEAALRTDEFKAFQIGKNDAHALTALRKRKRTRQDAQRLSNIALRPNLSFRTPNFAAMKKPGFPGTYKRDADKIAGIRTSHRKLPLEISKSNGLRLVTTGLHNHPPINWKQNTLGKDIGHKYKAALFSANLVDGIRASKRCEACSRSSIVNTYLAHNIQASPDMVRLHEIKPRNGPSKSGYFCGFCFEELNDMKKANRPLVLASTLWGMSVHQPGFILRRDLPDLTMSEEMMIARVHVVVAVHMVRQGNLVYRGSCMFLQKDSFKLVGNGLWSPSNLPIWVVRYGDVGLDEVTHQDFLVCPDVLQCWWEYKWQTQPRIFHGECEVPFSPSNVPSLSPGDHWCGSQVISSPPEWHKAPAGTAIINVANQLPGLQVPSDVPDSSTQDGANGNWASGATDGDDSANGKRPNKLADSTMKMHYTAVPLSISGELDMETITGMIAHAVSVADNDDEKGIDTHSPPPSPDGIPTRRSSEFAMETPCGVPPPTAHSRHTHRKPKKTVSSVADGLGGQRIDVGTRVEAAGLRMNERMARMPISKPVVPAAFAKLVDGRCYHAVQPTIKVSLFDASSREGLLQRAFPSLLQSATFDYFSKERGMKRENMLEFLLHYTDEEGHRPFAEHPIFMYCMLNVNLRLNNEKTKFVVADKAFEGKTVQDIHDEVTKGDKSVFKRVRGFTRNVIGTKAYWYHFKRQSLAFMHWKHWKDQCTATIFWTFTPADNWYASFFENCLPPDTKFSTNLTDDSMADTLRRQELVARHVVIALEHYKHMEWIFRNAFLERGLGAVDHLHRNETQDRKVFHTHGISWCDAAPSPATLQRACDFFQRFDSTDMPNRKRISGTVGEKDAVEQVIAYVAEALELTGSFGEDCKKCQPGYHRERDVTNVALKTRFTDVKQTELRDRWNTLRRRFKHLHSRSYCLRERTCAPVAPTVSPEGVLPKAPFDKKTANRSALKCRFHFFFKTCKCPSCLSADLCEDHQANVDYEEDGRIRAKAASKEFVVVECVCAGCTCQCGESCSAINNLPHIHVTRDSKDSTAARHFRMLPAMNHGAFNCTVEAAMCGFGCMIDIQFLIDPSKAGEYVAKYVCKPETDSGALLRSLTNIVDKCAQTAASEAMLASKILNGYVTERGYGNWETAAIALKHNLYELSRPSQTLSTSGGVCVAVEDSDDDGDDLVLENDNPAAFTELKSQYTTYARRTAFKDKSWYWCKTWANSKLTQLFHEPAYVTLCPNPKCRMPISSDSDDIKLKFEFYCEQRLLVHVPWMLDHKTLKQPPMAKWSDVLDAMMPEWVHELQGCLSSGSPNLPEWPLTHPSSCRLPLVLVHEYAHGLLERGYLVVQADWPEDDCEPETSESEDSEHGESLSDGGSSCDDVFGGAATNVTIDDHDADAAPGLLDDLLTNDHDWVDSSRRTLTLLGLDFLRLQEWLSAKKELQQGSRVPDYTVTREHLLSSPGMNQRAVFDYIVAKVESTQHFNMILQGPAGCGKSYLYKALKAKLGSKILFAAPTGVAALLI